MRYMVSSVTGLPKLRQLHDVLHSGHGNDFIGTGKVPSTLPSCFTCLSGERK